MLTALHAKTPERLDELISQCRDMTDKPFGVNLTILGEKRGTPEFPHEFCDCITRNGVKVVETCGSDPGLMAELNRILREGGVEVIMTKCVQIKHALTAQNRLGSDMVTLMGYDSGGLPGEADVGMWVQMALARQQLKIPFLVSGGVATGAQLCAALASGACGVQIGTRFNATQECNIFPDSFKARMLAAGDKDTVIVMKPFKASSRVLKNRTAEQMLAIERGGDNLDFKQYSSLSKFDTLMDGIAQADPDLGACERRQSGG
jgi:NAD(P)H-dependent flavin oxidoreductase YrpB (nitropropane dioxygenase family)